MSDLGDKKHEATSEQKEKFHKEGRFPKARDAGGLAATLAVIAALMGTSERSLRAIELCFAATHGDLMAITRGEGAAVTRVAAASLAALAVPAAVAAALGAAVVGLAQAGVSFDLGRVELKPERLDPLPRLKQLFSPQHGMIETLLALLRVAVVGVIAYRTLRDEIPQLLSLTTAPAAVAMHRVAASSLRLLLKVSGGLVLLAAIDYAQSWWTLSREMMMTTQQVKEEQRSQDGDPKLKARMRGRARALARRRMMNDVKKASVVVTNPTHVAVALRYQGTDPAPIVVAKGHDEVALRIRAEARKHGVPIIESRALARALDADVAIGKPIEGAHYAAVAQVLAFIYRLGKRGAPPGTARA